MAVSFQGLTTGVQTDQLVAAILAQEGQSVQRMLDKQTYNQSRTAALNTIRKDMNSLSTSLAAMKDRLNARTVTSTDISNVYVSATATGAAAGNYDLKVNQVATRGRLAPVTDPGINGGLPTLSVVDPAAAIFDSAKASFAVQGTDGVIKTFELTNNSLNGLRDAINSSSAGVTASVVNTGTGTGTKAYQLVISAKETGTGSGTGGVVSLATIDNQTGDPATHLIAALNLGIAGGSVTDPWGTTPTLFTGGLTSSAATTAQDAKFVLNGIELTRQTNVVKDAAEGMTFTLKQGLQAGTTSLTVAQDKAAATSGLQDVLSKYNILRNDYKTAATATKAADGSIVQGPLSGDQTVGSYLSQIHSALTAALSGPTGGSTITSAANLGISTGADGSLSLNVSTFQAAFDKDPTAVQSLFNFTGSSTSGAVSLKESTAKTTTGSVSFNISSYVSGGAVTGTFTVNGTPYSLSGSNGVLKGDAGTPLEGLSVSVLGIGTGTLNLTRGGGQKVQDLISSFTASGTGGIQQALTNIVNQNKSLDAQVAQGQARLDRRKVVLQRKFSSMETAVAQMKAAVGGLGGLG